MICPSFVAIVEEKMALTIEKAKGSLENTYGYQGPWVKSALPDDTSPHRIELHVSPVAPHFYVVADFANMKVKKFGPFMVYRGTLYATEVRL